MTAAQKIFSKLTQCGCSPSEAKSLINELLAEATCEQLAARRAADRARQRRFVEKRRTNVTNVSANVSNGQHQIIQQNQQTPNVTNVSDKNGVYIYNTIERKKESKKGGVGENIEFAEFWKAYPRRVAKQAALKAFCKARKEASKEEILAGVQTFLKNLPAPKFIPYPATWLNKHQWLDEPSHIANGPKWLNGIPGVI